MSITINISTQEIEALKQLTHLDNDAEAVTQAAREFLRLSRLRELKSASGKMDFDDSNWRKLEELELGDSGSVPKK